MRKLAGPIKRALRGRNGRDSGAQAWITIEPCKRTTSGWLVRLRVRNHGPAGTFHAQVVGIAISGSSAVAGNPPWDLAWRNQNGSAPQAHLAPGASELVRLAVARTEQPRPDLVLVRASAGDRSERLCPAAPDRPVIASVTLRSGESGELVEQRSVQIAFSERAGEVAPTVTFVAGTAPDAPRFAPDPATGAGAPGPHPVGTRQLSDADKQSLADILRCSKCGAQYDVSDTELRCRACGARYPVVDGIPVLTHETTIPTLLEDTDYDAVCGINDRVIVTTGAQWAEIIRGLGLEPTHALEIGSGTGALTLGLLKERAVGRLTAVDVSLKFLRALASKAASFPTPVSFVSGDANEAHFRPEAFDLVVGRSVLHHLLDYDQTIRQCAVMLKPGGAAVFFEPVLEGKIFLTLLMALVLRCEEMSDDPQLTPNEVRKVRGVMSHHMKAKLWPQDRESLSKIEDKYVFEIDQLRDVGRQAGFTHIEFVNNGVARRDYWPNLAWTFKVTGIAPEKIDRYRWIGEEFANTYGLMFEHKLVTPMGYFVFRK